MKRVTVLWFKTKAGREPVRDWVCALERIEDRKRIGFELKRLEFGWPIGMPLCRPMGDGLFELRTSLSGGRIARLMFYIDAARRLVLLHAFVKKTQRTPLQDLDLARKNKRDHETTMRRDDER